MKSVHFLLLFVFLLTACAPQATPPTPPAPPTKTAIPTPRTDCIESGDQNTINANLKGVGAVAILCPGAVFELTGPVIFNAEGQQVYTLGLPTDDSRATLRIVAQDVSTAVIMRDFNNATLSNVTVDGNRPELGHRSGDALIYAGGSSSGQVIRFNKIIEPRSWSAIHLIQGHPSPAPPCSDALVENNEISSVGSSNETWADGISLACTNTTIRNNLIVDATDGGIVIFGAPGSVIEGNTIRAETRTLLGGINMVDYAPYDGNYTDTIVRNNIIESNGAVIRIGLGMGTRVWGCLPESTTKDTLYGGTVSGNILRGDNMQYGFAVDGVREWTVIDNIDEAAHIGTPTIDCRGQIASNPAGFQYYPPRAQGTFQLEFAEAYVELALWAIVSPRPSE